MAIDNKLYGYASNNGAEVDTNHNLKVTLPLEPAQMGGAIQYNDNDIGDFTGVPFLYSPEVDTDYRQRVSQDLILDEEVFNYVAQNTNKHVSSASTLASTWTTGQFTMNSGGSTGIGSVTLTTWATFSCIGTQTLSFDTELAFSAQPTTNAIVEFGFNGAAFSGSAPSDGCFFRLTSGGLQGVLAYNGSETTTGLFPATNGTGVWSYTNNKRYQFICYIGGVTAYFWVNDGTGAKLLGSIQLPAAQGRLVMSGAMRAGFQQRHSATTSAALQTFVGGYNVRLGGSNITTTLSTQGNRIFGAYQGFSGGTMGSLANYANSANPTAAVPTNTTAALGTGLGGQFWETATLAANTDGIICSYQVPALAVSNRTGRLVIRGVYLTSYIQTAIASTVQYIRQYSLAWGHTSLSLSTAEATNSKAPRRLALPFTQTITVNQAIGTPVQQASYFLDLGDAPLFVNPNEYIQLVVKQIGTVATAGVIAHTVTFVYGWE